MKKENYIAPEADILEISSEGMLCASGEYTSHDDVDTEMFDRPEQVNGWF